MRAPALTSLWRLLNPRQRRAVILAQFASLLMAITTVAGIAAITPFFAVLSDTANIQRYPLLGALYHWGQFADPHRFEVALGIGFIGMALLSNAANFFGSYALQRIAFGIGNDMKSRLLREYLRRGLQFHSQTHSSTMLNNIIFEAVRGPIVMLQSLFQAVTGAITSLAIMLSMSSLHAASALAVGLTLVGGYALVYVAVRQRIAHSARAERALVGEQMKIVGEALGAIKQLLVMHRQAYFQQRFDQTCVRLARLAAHNDAITNSPRQIMECVAVAILASACLLLGDAHDAAGDWLPSLSFFGFAVYRLLPALQQTFAGLVRLRGARTGLAAIAMDLGGTAPAGPSFEPLRTALPLGRIELDAVSFAYGAAPRAVDAVSAVLPAGSVIGIVGVNGSGKTTLVDLIAGLLTPDAGRILIDGTDLAQLPLERWQAGIAYVPQQTFLLDLSLAENIALGVEPEDIDTPRLLRAARLADLMPLIDSLPAGFAQLLGERGVRLSGGQAQRVGIARALYRQASLLILDEATSSLDGGAESSIMTAIESIRGSLTVVLIAHRVASLRHCEWILQMCAGRLVAQGPAAELLPRLTANSLPAEVVRSEP